VLVFRKPDIAAAAAASRELAKPNKTRRAA
jgi:hypothetical protein